ncbi:MAG: hypothetical protein A2231_11585 [Candidatus Firestonebacteria bacterium RIFOXYA2_FULL_40_8]|nr:MAG: hypothetical protein A2231_11585 [Candidatus Firestonebacteria bacterium RIFOXYA2_FULL_40_8]
MGNPENLTRLLQFGSLFQNNLNCICGVFYDTAKILYYKQKRKSERLKTPYILKQNDISHVIGLTHYHYKKNKKINLHNGIYLLSKSLTETQALEYYQNNLIGKTKDIHGQSVIIDEDGICFLYKDNATGFHDIAPENYVEPRGRRLPWIRYTIENSKEIYKQDGPSRSLFFYVFEFEIPMSSQSNAIDYFVVVLKSERGKDLKFLTAYPVNKYNQFLNKIEEFYPYQHQAPKI